MAEALANDYSRCFPEKLPFSLILALLLAACSSVPDLPKRLASAERYAQTQKWQRQDFDSGEFTLAIWQPVQPQPAPQLTVYIEGDGLAWLNRYTPSDDPTPLSHTVLRMALAQPEGNAAYLARPCQFVMASAQPRCPERYWLAQRFAPEVIAAMNAALDALKSRFQASRLTLVGYSGGGAVAILLAARRKDVVRLITVAGNLDHRAWTTLHHITPLTGSLNPADVRMEIAALPQWHFVGGQDTIIPPRIAADFTRDLSAAQTIVIEGYDHQCCWAEQWPRLWRKLENTAQPPH